MKENNYIVIQGWMRNELGLKGNELLAYALVYGFSQDGDSWFSGSAKYVADWLGIDRRNALEVLKRLTQKGLIIKQDKIVNGVKLADYKVCHINIIGGDETSQGGGDETSHHNNSLGNPIDKKEKERKEIVDIDDEINRYTDNKDLRGAIIEFVEYRRNSRNKMSVLAVRKLLNTLKGFSVEEQIEAINVSIMSGWAGVFPRHRNEQQAQKGVGKVAHEADVYLSDFNEDGSFKW